MRLSIYVLQLHDKLEEALSLSGNEIESTFNETEIRGKLMSGLNAPENYEGRCRLSVETRDLSLLIETASWLAPRSSANSRRELARR